MITNSQNSKSVNKKYLETIEYQIRIFMNLNSNILMTFNIIMLQMKTESSGRFCFSINKM